MTADRSLWTILEAGDVTAVDEALRKNPQLVNSGVSLPGGNGRAAHPLHRICDCVFAKKYTEDVAVEIATIFLQYGARVDGLYPVEMQDTPLIAAASLHADKLARFYMGHGANIHHRGTHGGTALHWAAWTGRDVIVAELLRRKADVHLHCIDFHATPLFWAVHGYTRGGDDNRHNQVECGRLLIHAGADINTANKEGLGIHTLAEGSEFSELLTRFL